MNARSPQDPVAEELKRLLQGLVEAAQDVDVRASSYRSTTVLRASVANRDLGKVIGRQGRTVRALRTLLDLRGERDGRKYELEIREPQRRASRESA